MKGGNVPVTLWNIDRNVRELRSEIRVVAVWLTVVAIACLMVSMISVPKELTGQPASHHNEEVYQ